MDEIPDPICRRLAEVRVRCFGPRGKARFARALGIRPSTYQHYEQDRIPPADVLVRAAEITGCGLVWLLTGTIVDDAAESRESPRSTADGEKVLARLRELLRRHPDATATIERFADLLSQVLGEAPPIVPHPVVPHVPPDRDVPASASLRHWEPGELIPVLGSTAAGTARFWRELESEFGGAEADARLERLLAEQGARTIREAELVSASTESAIAPEVALVQLSQPDERGVIEFLSCPAARARFPRCVAWRIDGESMVPRYRDGDLVLTSPDEPALEGHPCVARQRGQLGVNCKIFRTEGDDVLLVPVNESYAIQRLAAADLQWTQRVLFSVRLER